MNSQELRELIMDEIRKLQEVNAFHSKTGRFSSKGNAETYSLTANALDNKTLSKDQEVPARGTVSKNGKIASKFGMNTSSPDKQCGRLTIKGKPKKKTRSCKDYPKKYKEGLLQDPKSIPEDVPSKNPGWNPPRKTKKPRKAIVVRILRKEGVHSERPISKKRKRDEIFPGSSELQSLARGITEQPDQDISLDDWIDGLKKLLATATPQEKSEVSRKLAKIGFYSGDTAAKLCKQKGLMDAESWLKLQNNISLSSKGELFKKSK
jgi:hypothetical protein